MAATIVAAAIAAGVGIYKLVQSSKEKKAAKKLAEQNKRPVYKIPTTEYDNQRLIEAQASQGLSDQSRLAATRNYDRGLSSSINAILQGGGNPNDVNNAYNIYDTNVGQLALADDAARNRNISRLIAQNNRMSDNLDKDYQINQYAPYADTAAKASQMYAQADNQQQDGLNTITSAASGVAGAYQRRAAINKEKGGTPDSSVSKYVAPYQSQYQSISGVSDPRYNASYGSPSIQNYINGKTYNNVVIDPSTGAVAREFNWGKIQDPTKRQNMYTIMNTRADWTNSYNNSIV